MFRVLLYCCIIVLIFVHTQCVGASSSQETELLVRIDENIFFYTVSKDGQALHSGYFPVQEKQNVSDLENFCVKFARNIKKLKNAGAYLLSRQNNTVCLEYQIDECKRLQYYWDLSGTEHLIQWSVYCGEQVMKPRPCYHPEGADAVCKQSAHLPLPSVFFDNPTNYRVACTLPVKQHTVLYHNQAKSKNTRRYKVRSSLVVNTRIKCKESGSKEDLLKFKGAHDNAIQTARIESGTLFFAEGAHKYFVGEIADDAKFCFLFLFSNTLLMRVCHNNNPIFDVTLPSRQMEYNVKLPDKSYTFPITGTHDNICWEGGQPFLMFCNILDEFSIVLGDCNFFSYNGYIYFKNDDSSAPLVESKFDAHSIQSRCVLKEDRENLLQTFILSASKYEWMQINKLLCASESRALNDMCQQPSYSFRVRALDGISAIGHIHAGDTVMQPLCYCEYVPSTSCDCDDYARCRHSYWVLCWHVYSHGQNLAKDAVGLELNNGAYLPMITKYASLARVFTGDDSQNMSDWQLLGKLMATKTGCFLDIYFNAQRVVRLCTKTTSLIQDVLRVSVEEYRDAYVVLKLILDNNDEVFLRLARKIYCDPKKLALRLVCWGECLQDKSDVTLTLLGQKGLSTSIYYEQHIDHWSIYPHQGISHSFVLSYDGEQNSLQLKYQDLLWDISYTQGSYNELSLSPCALKGLDGVDMSLGGGRFATLCVYPKCVWLYQWCDVGDQMAMHIFDWEKGILNYWSALHKNQCVWGRVFFQDDYIDDVCADVSYSDDIRSIIFRSFVNQILCDNHILSVKALFAGEAYGGETCVVNPHVENHMLVMSIDGVKNGLQKHVTFDQGDFRIMDFMESYYLPCYKTVHMLKTPFSIEGAQAQQNGSVIKIVEVEDLSSSLAIKIVDGQQCYELHMPEPIQSLLYRDSIGREALYGSGEASHVLQISSGALAYTPNSICTFTITSLNAPMFNKEKTFCWGCFQHFDNGMQPWLSYTHYNLEAEKNSLDWYNVYKDIHEHRAIVAHGQILFKENVLLPKNTPYIREKTIFSLNREICCLGQTSMRNVFNIMVLVGPKRGKNFKLILLKGVTGRKAEVVCTKVVHGTPCHVSLRIKKDPPFVLDVSFWDASGLNKLWFFSVMPDVLPTCDTPPSLLFQDESGIFLNIKTGFPLSLQRSVISEN